METNNQLSCQQEESNLKLREEYFGNIISFRKFCPRLYRFYGDVFFDGIIWKIFQEGFQNQYLTLQYTAMSKSKSALSEG